VVSGWVLFATAGTQLYDPLALNIQGLQPLPDDAHMHFSAQVLHQESHTAVIRMRECVETHTLPPWRDRSALTAALKR
jgi:hypothetical protein